MKPRHSHITQMTRLWLTIPEYSARMMLYTEYRRARSMGRFSSSCTQLNYCNLWDVVSFSLMLMLMTLRSTGSAVIQKSTHSSSRCGTASMTSLHGWRLTFYSSIHWKQHGCGVFVGSASAPSPSWTSVHWQRVRRKIINCAWLWCSHQLGRHIKNSRDTL